MKTMALIIIGSLCVWWFVQVIILLASHRQRVIDAKTPPTAAVREECRRLSERLPRYKMRPVDWIWLSPLIVLMLPFYLYGWLVPDPYDKHKT